MKCERCSFEFESNKDLKKNRCPRCGWRQLLGKDGEIDEEVLKDEENAREYPKDVMFRLSMHPRKLVEVIVGPGYCFTYEDQNGIKHTFWPGRHTDTLGIWKYWVHPDPLAVTRDHKISAILVFEYENQGITRFTVEILGQNFPMLAGWYGC
jgi:hypothetical protein